MLLFLSLSASSLCAHSFLFPLAALEPFRNPHWAFISRPSAFLLSHGPKGPLLPLPHPQALAPNDRYWQGQLTKLQAVHQFCLGPGVSLSLYVMVQTLSALTSGQYCPSASPELFTLFWKLGCACALHLLPGSYCFRLLRNTPARGF